MKPSRGVGRADRSCLSLLILATKLALYNFKHQSPPGGSLVLVSSISGYFGGRDVLQYKASKHGVSSPSPPLFFLYFSRVLSRPTNYSPNRTLTPLLSSPAGHRSPPRSLSPRSGLQLPRHRNCAVHDTDVSAIVTAGLGSISVSHSSLSHGKHYEMISS